MLIFYFKTPLHCDYLPVLSPGKEIIDDVSYLKQKAVTVIRPYQGMKGIAHITMRDNLMNKDKYLTERCLMELEKKWRKLYSIDLDTKGFGCFNSTTGDTIYLALNQTPVNRLWFSEVLRTFNSNKKRFTPHITVTKNISHNAFELLWPKYKDADHSKRFRVNKLTILRRETFDKDSNYEIFTEFPFKHELFNDSVASKHFFKKYINEKRPIQQYKLF